MGEIVNMQAIRDAQITGTTDPVRLELLVRILTKMQDRNNAAQRGKLAAAKRLLNQETNANGTV